MVAPAARAAALVSPAPARAVTMGRRAATIAAGVAVAVAAGCAGATGAHAETPGAAAPAPAPPRPTPPIPMGPARAWTGPVPVLESTPCLKPDQRNWRAAEREKIGAELSGSGLDKAAARLSPRLGEVYPDAQVAALQRASGDGRCRRIVYRSDGLRVVGFILEPFGAQPRSLPGVIYARGGNRDAGAIGPALLSHLQAIADRGFVVAATQYRGVDGGEGHDQYGGDDVHDLEALLPLLRNVPAYDNRAYLYGHSRGGMEAYEALRDGLPVRAAAITGGIADLGNALRARPEMEEVARDLVPEWTTKQGVALLKRSALRWVDQLRVPLLIVHAKQDARVPFRQAEAMDATLTRLGKQHRFVPIDRDAHALYLHRALVVDEVARWFATH
jgi:dienelactone hydrolase